ncbi:hypothetical protein X975_24974, partial [Stegodyphus mimosarum]
MSVICTFLIHMYLTKMQIVLLFNDFLELFKFCIWHFLVPQNRWSRFHLFRMVILLHGLLSTAVTKVLAGETTRLTYFSALGPN